MLCKQESYQSTKNLRDVSNLANDQVNEAGTCAGELMREMKTGVTSNCYWRTVGSG